jgi:hypothetical protein
MELYVPFHIHFHGVHRNNFYLFCLSHKGEVVGRELARTGVMGIKKVSRNSEWKRPRSICRHWYNGNVKLLVKENTF